MQVYKMTPTPEQKKRLDKEFEKAKKIIDKHPDWKIPSEK